MNETTELIVLPPKETALQVYSTPQGLEPYLAKIKEELDSFVPDVTTKKGRDAIASIAYKVAKGKTALDNIGKELVAELKDVPKGATDGMGRSRSRARGTPQGRRPVAQRPGARDRLSQAGRIASRYRRRGCAGC